MKKSKPFDVRNYRPAGWQDNNVHASFGIQNWLVRNGYIVDATNQSAVDVDKFKELKREFFLFKNVDKTNEHINHNEFIQANFSSFCSFCIKKFGAPITSDGEKLYKTRMQEQNDRRIEYLNLRHEVYKEIVDQHKTKDKAKNNASNIARSRMKEKYGEGWNQTHGIYNPKYA